MRRVSTRILAACVDSRSRKAVTRLRASTSTFEAQYETTVTLEVAAGGTCGCSTRRLRGNSNFGHFGDERAIALNA